MIPRKNRKFASKFCSWCSVAIFIVMMKSAVGGWVGEKGVMRPGEGAAGCTATRIARQQIILLDLLSQYKWKMIELQIARDILNLYLLNNITYL